MALRSPPLTPNGPIPGLRAGRWHGGSQRFSITGAVGPTERCNGAKGASLQRGTVLGQPWGQHDARFQPPSEKMIHPRVARKGLSTRCGARRLQPQGAHIRQPTSYRAAPSHMRSGDAVQREDTTVAASCSPSNCRSPLSRGRWRSAPTHSPAAREALQSLFIPVTSSPRPQEQRRWTHPHNPTLHVVAPHFLMAPTLPFTLRGGQRLFKSLLAGIASLAASSVAGNSFELLFSSRASRFDGRRAL
ncbi:uncharacterized protein LOC121112045 [Gallus gallus]|uniref:uncharacterized protein LOC121112045 n=1 Tax=Gallus gallus TaxID=9031 RepID=UPI001AE5FA15|nr:uncharacterized protein LOC121112045 [Gallus gallus]